ncbi:MAG: pilin, partial [Giesbergeria sp.]
ERSNIAAAARTKSSESAFQEEQLTYAFQSIDALKLHVAEWLIVTQTIPNSNDDAKLPNPAYYQSEILSDISIGKGGTVTALFKDFPGTLGAWVRFSPKSINPEKMMTWKCESNIPNITQLRPTCLWIE